MAHRVHDMSKPVIFSGIQPTGNLHLGNFLGAVKQWVELQNSGTYQCYFCIVDYHSLTGKMTADERRAQVMITATELLAAGIDPKKSTLFIQSHVPEHTELGWIFNTVTPIAELERMTQFKEKYENQKQNINAGLFTYPILQAADILLYQATHVPVGEDQVQHVELTRDIARWFNNRYAYNFPETAAVLTETPRVKSLLEPDKKMSKSLGQGHVIELGEESSSIEKKIQRAVTATAGGGIAPGAQNLLLLYKHFGDPAHYERFIREEKEGTIRYGELKTELSSALSNYFADFRARKQKLLANPDRVAKIFAAGAKQAREVAQVTMKQVRQKIGIR